MSTAAKFAHDVSAADSKHTQAAKILLPGLHLKVKAASFGLAVAAIGLVLDLVMARLLHHFWAAEIMGNVLTGVLAGYAMFRYSVYRVTLSKQRASQIAYLNHHIRNALTVIVLSHEAGNQRLNLIRDASERIQQALNQFASDDNLQLPPFTSDVSSTPKN